MRYRKCVGIFLINHEKKIFVAQRKNINLQLKQHLKLWQMPQGGILNDEKPIQAAYRELYEETAITDTKLLAESAKWHYYDLPYNLKQKLWNGKFIGQKQKWFAMQFRGQNDDIKLDQHQDPEFINWKWAKPQELPELAIYFKKNIYTELLEEFHRFY